MKALKQNITPLLRQYGTTIPVLFSNEITVLLVYLPSCIGQETAK